MPDDAPQPSPHQCQFCGRDIAQENHKLDCRVVVDIDGIEGWTDIPAFLDRRRPRPGGGVFE